MSKPTRAQIQAQLKKVNILACKNKDEGAKFDLMIREYYGEEHYSDHDEDQIIDCLDYGQGMISFEEFDQIMRKINREPKED